MATRTKLDSALRKYKNFEKDTGVLHLSYRKEHAPRSLRQQKCLSECLKYIFLLLITRDAVRNCFAFVHAAPMFLKRLKGFQTSSVEQAQVDGHGGFQSAALGPMFLLTSTLCFLLALLDGSPDAELPGMEPCQAAPARDGFFHHSVNGQAGSAVMLGQGNCCRCLSLRERGRLLGDTCM